MRSFNEVSPEKENGGLIEKQYIKKIIKADSFLQLNQ